MSQSDPVSGSASATPSRARPSPIASHPWPRFVAASLALLYLAGVAMGWLTNGSDGYYGVTRLDTPPAEPSRIVIADVAAGSPADRAGLRAGDDILAIDGDRVGETLVPGFRRRLGPQGASQSFQLRPLTVPPGDVPAFRHLTGDRKPGTRSIIRIQRPGGADSAGLAQDLTVVVGSRLDAPGLVVAILTWHIVALLTLAVGVIVLLRRPSDIASRLLLAMATPFAMALVLLSWSNRPLPAEVALFLQQATVLLLVSGSASLVHLCLAFPAPHPLLTRLRAVGPRALARFGGLTFALYLLPGALALGLFLGPSHLWPWSYLVVIPLLGLALLALARSLLHPPSSIARAQLKWIAGPLAVGLCALALGPGVSVATGARSELLPATAVVAAWALFPIGLGVAIMRYRLFDVDIVVRAATFYPLLAALLAGGYLAAALGLGQLATAAIGPSAADNPVTSVLAALVVAAAAQPVYRRLRAGLDRLLYRDRLARQRLLEEAMALPGQASPEEVATFLTGHVANRLDLSRAWLVLPGGVTAADGSVPSTLLRSVEPLLARMRDVIRPLFLLKQEELALGGPSALVADDPVLTAWYAAGARLLLPLRAMRASADGDGAGLLGLWLLGPRRSGSLPDSEDVKTLAQIGRQGAVLLDYDRLHWREATGMRRIARFRRYFSPQIADLITEEGAELATHRRELTVLFAELRGFGALSEILEPEELAEKLSEYLVAMTEVVFGEGGTLDKYLGDGVMAFFGDPVPQPDHAARAMRAALAMQHRIKEMGQPTALPPVAVGIGLATGWVTVGTIGSAARQEYTVVGDAVTIASRLAATAGGGEVLMAERTRRLLGVGTAVVSRGEVSVEGRRQPAPVFALSADPDTATGTPGAPVARPRRRDRGNGVEVGAGAKAGAELLARTPLFASLPPEELRDLAARLRLRRHKKGEMILRAHEPGSSFFLIRAGTVKVTRASATGDEAVMNILGPGEFFGELAMLGGQSGGSTVVALQSTETLVLSRQEFLGCLQAHPSAASAAIRLLSERIRRLTDQLEDAYTLELPQRLARQLLALGSMHGKKTEEGLVIDLPLTQSDLAGMVGASRQRVNRLLAQWQDRRLLRLGSYGRMTLLRPDTFTDLSPEQLDS